MQHFSTHSANENYKRMSREKHDEIHLLWHMLSQKLSKWGLEVRVKAVIIQVRTPRCPFLCCYQVPLDHAMVPKGAKVEATCLPTGFASKLHIMNTKNNRYAKRSTHLSEEEQIKHKPSKPTLPTQHSHQPTDFIPSWLKAKRGPGPGPGDAAAHPPPAPPS